MQQLSQQVLHQRQFQHQNQAALAALQQNAVANQQQLAALPQNVTQLKVAQDVKYFLENQYLGYVTSTYRTDQLLLPFIAAFGFVASSLGVSLIWQFMTRIII